MIKMKYFHNYYYKVMKLKCTKKKKIILGTENKVLNNINENNIYNKIFNYPLRTIFQTSKSNYKSINYKLQNLTIMNNSKNKFINKKEGNELKKIEKYREFYKLNNHILNNNFIKKNFENKTFENKFSKMINDKNNDIIFNYINDMENYKRIFKNKRRFLYKNKNDLISGNKTFTNKIISENMLNKKKKWFDCKDNEIFKYERKNRNIKKENEKNNEEKETPTININNYYFLNSSFINENLKRDSLHDLYEKEYKSSPLKNLLLKINFPNQKLVNLIKKLKSKNTSINNKDIKNDIYNKISIKSDKHSNIRNNDFYKSVQNKFPKSSKNIFNKLNLAKKNKNSPPILKDRIQNQIQINKPNILNITNKGNKNIVFKPNNLNKSMNTRNNLENYNNSLLTTYYKDKNNGKETDDSGLYTISKNTSNRKYLLNQLNGTYNKNKNIIPCSNNKKLNRTISNEFVSTIKKNNTSNKKVPKPSEKNNSNIEITNNKKDKINNHTLILENLSFSNSSENKNLSENKAKNQIQVNKKRYNDINKIINQKLDYFFIQNDDEHNINNKNYDGNRNKIIGKEKIIETSSETLNDSQIFELAKIYIQNDEEYFDKHMLEEILKIKRIKK